MVIAVVNAVVVLKMRPRALHCQANALPPAAPRGEYDFTKSRQSKQLRAALNAGECSVLDN